MPADLQSAPFGRSGIPPTDHLSIKLAKGLEPPTLSLQMRCSTKLSYASTVVRHGSQERGQAQSRTWPRLKAPIEPLLGQRADVLEHRSDLVLAEDSSPSGHAALAVTDHLQQLLIRPALHVRAIGV